jgi:hypothetical protein
MDADVFALSNVTVAETAEAFAAALREAVASGDSQETTTGPGRVYYEKRFSLAAYREAIETLAAPLCPQA